MREFTQEEINQFWEQAYYRASNLKNQVYGTWILVFTILAPVSLFGFLLEQIVAWGLFAVFTLFSFYYGVSIWRKSEKGEFPARFAIVRNQIISTHVNFILWLVMLLFAFGFIVSENSSNLLLIIAITISAYIISIVIVLSSFEKGRTNRSKDVNFFATWRGGAFGLLVVFLAVSTSLLTSIQPASKMFVFMFSGSALFFFTFPFGRAYLIWALLRMGLDKSPYQATLKEVKKQIKEERKARRYEPEVLPIWCEGCAAQGKVTINDNIGDHYVICEECGTETSQIWCEDEEVGGQFVPDIHEHPLEYDCEVCRKTHQLPADFYEKPVTLELIEEPRNKRK